MKIRLENAGGDFVGNTVIAPFMMMPPVLIWNDRVFQLHDISCASQEHHVYRECFAVVITEEVGS